MSNACPAPGVDAPLVRGLLGLADCNVHRLVHGGYAALFPTGGGLSLLLTALMTLYVAILGYQLMLGRTELRVGDVALNAFKLGIILALATQWETYQAVVYDLLFQGPQQLADGVQAAAFDEPSGRGQVMDRLQGAFDALSGDAAAYAGHAPAQVSPLVGGAGFAALALTLSATALLLSSLGVLVASKIVLGLLLAVGPVFIVLLLFDATRGLFEGWMRACLAFALAPLAVTLLLGVALSMLEPSLAALAETVGKKQFDLAPVYSAMLMVLVFAGVAASALLAGGVIAGGLKLPATDRLARSGHPGGAPMLAVAAELPRSARVAAAAAALDRRDMAQALLSAPPADRRSRISPTPDRSHSALGGAPAPDRLGQGARRSAQPREPRGGPRSLS